MRRKRNLFTFRKDKFTIIVDDITSNRPVQKEVNGFVIGDWGYHTYFKNEWTVTHVPTGFAVSSYDNKKDAVVLIKRLFTKARSEWHPKPEILKNFSEWYFEILKLIKKSGSSYKLFVDRQDVTNTNEDIPF